MSNAGIKIVFGGGAFGHTFSQDEEINEVLNELEKSGIKNIDSAQMYGESEALLGKAGAPNRFVVDTKDPCGLAGELGQELSREAILARGLNSLERLQTKKVDIFYLHCPPTTDKLPEVLAGVNDLFQRGAFARFGISNFTPEEVEATYGHCKEKNYVLPSVYQGNYNPVARRPETELLPALRKLGIAFYAYSPLAGGFLTKTKEQIADGAGRFKDNMLGKIYLTMYGRPSYLEALGRWQNVAEEEGASRAELAYRWVVYNSPLKAEHGDAIIIGASSLGQLKNTVEFLRHGPLSAKATEGVDKVWDSVKADAPLDNYNDYIKSNGFG